MKKKILIVLLIVNTVLLLVYFLPVFKVLLKISFYSKAGAIGIIGGVDGPTAIFVSTSINWFPIVIISLEVILGIYLLLTRSKR